MSGYEACDRIHDYLYPEKKIKYADETKKVILKRVSKTLIFSLSGDSSSDTYRMLRMHPFDDYLESLSPSELSRLVTKTRPNYNPSEQQLFEDVNEQSFQNQLSRS